MKKIILTVISTLSLSAFSENTVLISCELSVKNIDDQSQKVSYVLFKNETGSFISTQDNSEGSPSTPKTEKVYKLSGDVTQEILTQLMNSNRDQIDNLLGSFGKLSNTDIIAIIAATASYQSKNLQQMGLPNFNLNLSKVKSIEYYEFDKGRLMMPSSIIADAKDQNNRSIGKFILLMRAIPVLCQ